MWILTSNDPTVTRALGRALAQVITRPTIVALVGELGAGKTCFAQGVGAGLHIDEPITSPTFTLMAEYEGVQPMLHSDTYRLETLDEAYGIGLPDEIDAWPGVVLVEWANRFPELLPPDHLRVELRHQATGREIHISSHGPRSEELVTAWRARWTAHEGKRDA